jgi:dTDP-4-amino-4,6-dideoxygalactose transaminase
MGKVTTLLPYVIPRRGAVVGDKLARYEAAFAAYVGAPHAVGFWKGRVAFAAALKALGLQTGDEIVMPAYTCLVVPAAAQMLGIRCVYVDIEPVYCTPDPAQLMSAVTPRTQAVMIQHTYGWPSAGTKDIQAFCRQRGIALIEDCCHALGTRCHGRHVGTFGDAAFFSSQWSKPYTTGLGGMLVVNNESLAERVRGVREQEACRPAPRVAAQLAAQGILFDLLVFPRTVGWARRTYRWATRRGWITGSTGADDYRTPPPDFLKWMSEAQAAAGLVELSKLEAGVTHRRQVTSWYDELLQERGWPTLAAPLGAEVTLLRYPVRVKNKEAALAEATSQLIELGDWFNQPLHSHLAAQQDFGYRPGMCPHADRAAREIVNLPLHTRIKRRAAEKIVRFLTKRCAPAAEHPPIPASTMS